MQSNLAIFLSIFALFFAVGNSNVPCLSADTCAVGSDEVFSGTVTIQNNTNYGVKLTGNPTANRTITFPDADGTVKLAGATLTANKILASDTNGEVSLVLGLSNPNDQLSFFSKEKMITDGLDIYVMAGDLLGPSGNGSGYGPQIDVWPNISFVTVPGTPTGISATGGNAEADVSWTAPVSDGGSVISQYTVTSSPDGITATTSGTSVTVTGLTNGTSYTFVVTATNSVGTGSASGASSAVVPATVPGSPTAVSAVGGNAQATVSWTPPVSYGGSAISQYTVTSSPDGITATT